MRLILVPLTVALLGTISCSDARPTQPSPGVEPPSTGTPTAAFTLTVDSLASQEAIADVSNITVDASASTGAGLRVEVAFGDGETAATTVARHVYRTPGSFTVTLTVTDNAGRTTTSTRQLVVASPLGRWVHSGFIDRRGEVQVRTLLLSAQDGLTVRGALTRDGNRTIPVTGTLTAERTIRLVLEDGSEVLEGAIPSVFSTLTTWPLTSRGGSIDGQPLAFTRIAGEVTGAAPDAVLGMRFFAFGAPFAVKQISPVLFDGSASRGEGLTYYLEFGDGQSATTDRATHPMQTAGSYVARLTVVDRFGRSDVEETGFEVTSLLAYNGRFWAAPLGGCPRPFCGMATLAITSQEGTAVKGTFTRLDLDRSHTEAVTGSITADGQVHLQLQNSDATLAGSMVLPSRYLGDWRLTLTYSGGVHAGDKLDFVFHESH